MQSLWIATLISMSLGVSASASQPTVPMDENSTKTCLAMAYAAQQARHDARQPYTSRTRDLALDRNPYCQGLELSIPTATATAFKVIARSGQHVWTVDQTKTIENVQ